ncbi:LacI family DNA-binding transcriptional regulator [Ruania alkalisoli]|uniref:LacI family DNA-binding transcriptional regulator n=1 Tax=Ruania alkalisoli TaxID=2779775 RepID=A0A7M1SW60_9MICO|nr:LacI family DNA-binding transcriptional regulator [Ruania alkalisoli]QOR71799.1 LacI family DNA-binding transcriptional regulator [Ruania alkalisoli]
MSPASQVTLSDVASVAGVSLSTASRALRGEGRIAQATRDRIVDAARRLDFQPNMLAQSFASGRSRTVGILSQRAVGTFSAPIIIGAVRELGQSDNATLLYDADFSLQTLTSNIRKLQSRRIDALLMVGDTPDRALPSVTDAFPVPVAYAFLGTTDPDDAVFLPDYVQAGRLAGEHLLEIGRTRIAHISAAPTEATVRLREQGVRESLQDADLDLVASLTEGGTWSRQWGVLAAERLLASGVDVDAIFCGNDQIAFGAIETLRARGLRVPDDVAIVGMDNWPGVMPHQDVNGLTTVDPRLTELGAAAAAYLTGGQSATGAQVQPCSLIIGQSTVPPVAA